MNILSSPAYHKAFVDYVRKGTAISVPIQHHPTTHYVWRTERDGKVRPKHRANDGKIFAWSTILSTGHPGESPGCRCRAEPYYEGKTEFASHTIVSDLSSTREKRWELGDFYHHFVNGDGKEVSLREIGHLGGIVEQYAYKDQIVGAFLRISGQIADKARDSNLGFFGDDFRGAYNFKEISWAHGKSTINGYFLGTVRERGDMLHIEGQVLYVFYDIFTDPLDLREIAAWLRSRPEYLWRLVMESFKVDHETAKQKIDPDNVSDIFMFISDLGHKPYLIRDTWRTEFVAEVWRDRDKSQYHGKK